MAVYHVAIVQEETRMGVVSIELYHEGNDEEN